MRKHPRISCFFFFGGGPRQHTAISGYLVTGCPTRFQDLFGIGLGYTVEIFNLTSPEAHRMYELRYMLIVNLIKGEYFIGLKSNTYGYIYVYNIYIYINICK